MTTPFIKDKTLISLATFNQQIKVLFNAEVPLTDGQVWDFNVATALGADASKYDLTRTLVDVYAIEASGTLLDGYYAEDGTTYLAGIEKTGEVRVVNQSGATKTFFIRVTAFVNPVVSAPSSLNGKTLVSVESFNARRKIVFNSEVAMAQDLTWDFDVAGILGADVSKYDLSKTIVQVFLLTADASALDAYYEEARGSYDAGFKTTGEVRVIPNVAGTFLVRITVVAKPVAVPLLGPTTMAQMVAIDNGLAIDSSKYLNTGASVIEIDFQWDGDTTKGWELDFYAYNPDAGGWVSGYIGFDAGAQSAGLISYGQDGVAGSPNGRTNAPAGAAVPALAASNTVRLETDNGVQKMYFNGTLVFENAVAYNWTHTGLEISISSWSSHNSIGLTRASMTPAAGGAGFLDTFLGTVGTLLSDHVTDSGDSWVTDPNGGYAGGSGPANGVIAAIS